MQTTIRIDGEIAQTLFNLKKELGWPSASETIKHLVNLYRETHGWSTIAVAEELKHMEETDATSI